MNDLYEKIEWDYNDNHVLVLDDGTWRIAVPSEIVSEILSLQAKVERLETRLSAVKALLKDPHEVEEMIGFDESETLKVIMPDELEAALAQESDDE